MVNAEQVSTTAPKIQLVPHQLQYSAKTVNVRRRESLVRKLMWLYTPIRSSVGVNLCSYADRIR